MKEKIQTENIKQLLIIGLRIWDRDSPRFGAVLTSGNAKK